MYTQLAGPSLILLFLPTPSVPCPLSLQPDPKEREQETEKNQGQERKSQASKSKFPGDISFDPKPRDRQVERRSFSNSKRRHVPPTLLSFPPFPDEITLLLASSSIFPLGADGDVSLFPPLANRFWVEKPSRRGVRGGTGKHICRRALAGPRLLLPTGFQNKKE